MNKTNRTARNAYLTYNKLVVRCDEQGVKFCALAWTHASVRLEIAAKTSGPIASADLRSMAKDARHRAEIARHS